MRNWPLRHKRTVKYPDQPVHVHSTIIAIPVDIRAYSTRLCNQAAKTLNSLSGCEVGSRNSLSAYEIMVIFSCLQVYYSLWYQMYTDSYITKHMNMANPLADGHFSHEWQKVHFFFFFFFVCVLRFYGPVNPMWSFRARSVYPTTRLLGRLSPLSG